MNDAMRYGAIAVAVLVLVSLGMALLSLRQGPQPPPTPAPTPTPFLLRCVTVADCPPGAARCMNNTCVSTDEHGCVPDGGYQWCAQKQKCLRPWEENCTASNSGIPNPAATYCTNIGYTLGGENCVFSSTASCEQWEFYRGRCGREFSFCEKDGFTLQNRTEDMNGWTSEYAVCVFPDGSECLEQDYLAGTCTEGQCGHWSQAAGCTT